MKKALRQISKSPFTRGIEKVKLPRRFHQPTFAIYNGQTDSVEHVSQFKQKMAVHSQDEALMCRVFPSNLGPMPMRWFNGLRTNSISSFKKLTQSFCSRFITCSRVPQPLDSLLSMSGREILKSVTITSIASIIKIMDTPQRIVGVCGIIWTNLSKRAN